MPTIVHVPYTYIPDPLGGTEIYVQSLARELQRHGWTSIIAAPGGTNQRLETDAATVLRFEHGNAPGAAEGVPDVLAAEQFDRILEQMRPDIVHLHARTSPVSALLLARSRRRGIRTVVTYHSPTMSCPRGTMLHDGRVPCDGRLEVSRCTRCVLGQHGLPPIGSSVLAATPRVVGRLLERFGLRRGPWLAVRMRDVVYQQHQRFHEFASNADHIVAVCDWVAKALLINCVDPGKLSLSRQGLTQVASVVSDDAAKDRHGALRIGFFGRLHPTKGIDTLIAAVRASSVDLTLAIYGVGQEGTSDYERKLRALAAGDLRIAFHDALPSARVVETMRNLDLVAIPSIWMETGPLVALEAFEAGTPVIASDRGGLSELVRDGIDGVLVAPGDPEAWRDAISDLASDRSRVATLRRNIEPPRTMAAAAAEMDALYRKLLRSAVPA